MARVRTNFQRGTITDDPLTDVATTINSAEFSSLPAGGSLILVLDPRAVNGAPEIVTVTAHTSSATSATVTRGDEGSTARQHPSGTAWIAAPTANDYLLVLDDPASDVVDPYAGQFVYEPGDERLVNYNGSDWVGPRLVQTVNESGGNATLPDDGAAYTIETADITLDYPCAVFVKYQVRLTSSTTAGNYDGSIRIRTGGSTYHDQLATAWFLVADGGHREVDTYTSSAFVNLDAGVHTFTLEGVNVVGSVDDVNAADSRLIVQELTR